MIDTKKANIKFDHIQFLTSLGLLHGSYIQLYLEDNKTPVVIPLAQDECELDNKPRITRTILRSNKKLIFK